MKNFLENSEKILSNKKQKTIKIAEAENVLIIHKIQIGILLKLFSN